MKLFKNDGNKFLISDDLSAEMKLDKKENFSQFCDACFQAFASPMDGQFLNYSDEVVRKRKKRDETRFLVINAHGDDTNGRWTYCDNGEINSLQTLVSEYDGKADTILLFVCNPGAHEVRTKKSLVMFFDRITGGSVIRNFFGVSALMFDPKLDEIIDSNTIDFHVENAV